MIASLLPLALLFLAGPGAPAATLTTDLDGDGSLEMVAVSAEGRQARIQIRDPSGLPLAEALSPAPGSRNPRVVLSTGSLGSAGALLEVGVSDAESGCRAVWRYREKTLTRVPAAGPGGPLPDCALREEWSYRWERPAPDAPALYVRERSRARPRGTHREVEFYRYTGFRLELDAARSLSEIAGVAIPDWSEPVLYQKSALEHLNDKFDLSPLRSAPRLSIVADRAGGRFEVRLRDPAGEESFPVTALSREEGKNEFRLSAGEPPSAASVRLVLSRDGRIPLEAVLKGFGPRYDNPYTPVTRVAETQLRVFGSAEQELAEELLPGTWSGGKGNPLVVVPIGGSPPAVRIGKSEAAVDIARAPRGTDFLLVPRDGKPPSLGILLKGPNGIELVPVRCSPARKGKEPVCSAAGPGNAWRRVGSRLNVR